MFFRKLINYCSLYIDTNPNFYKRNFRRSEWGLDSTHPTQSLYDGLVNNMTNSEYFPRFPCPDKIGSSKIIIHNAHNQGSLTNVNFDGVQLIVLSSKPPKLNKIAWFNQNTALKVIDGFGVENWNLNDVKLENITESGISINRDDSNIQIESSTFKNVKKNILWKDFDATTFYKFEMKNQIPPEWSTFSLCSGKVYKLYPDRLGYWLNYYWLLKNVDTFGCRSRFEVSEGFRIKIEATTKIIYKTPILKVFNSDNDEEIDSFSSSYVSLYFYL